MNSATCCHKADREVLGLEVLSPQAPLGANERAGRNGGFAPFGASVASFSRACRNTRRKRVFHRPTRARGLEYD